MSHEMNDEWRIKDESKMKKSLQNLRCGTFGVYQEPTSKWEGDIKLNIRWTGYDSNLTSGTSPTSAFQRTNKETPSKKNRPF